MSRIVFALATSLIIAGVAMGQTVNSHVTVECADPAICASLEKALNEAPALPHPLTLTLVVEKRTDHSFQAYLSWEGVQNGRGESMSLSVMDTTMQNSMIDRFISDLVRHSGLPE